MAIVIMLVLRLRMGRTEQDTMVMEEKDELPETIGYSEVGSTRFQMIVYAMPMFAIYTLLIIFSPQLILGTIDMSIFITIMFIIMTVSIVVIFVVRDRAKDAAAALNIGLFYSYGPENKESTGWIQLERDPIDIDLREVIAQQRARKEVADTQRMLQEQAQAQTETAEE